MRPAADICSERRPSSDARRRPGFSSALGGAASAPGDVQGFLICFGRDQRFVICSGRRWAAVQRRHPAKGGDIQRFSPPLGESRGSSSPMGDVTEWEARSRDRGRQIRSVETTRGDEATVPPTFSRGFREETQMRLNPATREASSAALRSCVDAKTHDPRAIDSRAGSGQNARA